MTIVCSTRRFCTLVKHLSQDKKDEIERIGFGSLLSLPDITLERKLIGQIADRYDPNIESVIIQGTAVPITPWDVQCIMGLRADGLIIEPKPHMDDDDYKYYFIYKEKQGMNISLHHLEEQLIKAKNADEHFIRRFVLFTIGFLLCPTTKAFVSSHYLALVKDIEQIRHINWAKVTRDFLIKSLNALKTGQRSLEGNVALLQVCYELILVSIIYAIILVSITYAIL